jgi:hypothetical protein
MLEAVYVDTKETRSIVAIKPRAAFRPILSLATTRMGSGGVLTPGLDDPAAGAGRSILEAAFVRR